MRNCLLLFILLALAACAHHRDVRPNANGNHKVSFLVDDKTQGYPDGISQARHFCEESKKSAYVVKEGHKYIGRLKEDTYHDRKAAAKIASGVGAGAMVLGGKKEKEIGGVLGMGGGIADGVIGKGYSYTMIFQCK